MLEHVEYCGQLCGEKGCQEPDLRPSQTVWSGQSMNIWPGRRDMCEWFGSCSDLKCKIFGWKLVPFEWTGGQKHVLSDWFCIYLSFGFRNVGKQQIYQYQGIFCRKICDLSVTFLSQSIPLWPSFICLLPYMDFVANTCGPVVCCLPGMPPNLSVVLWNISINNWLFNKLGCGSKAQFTLHLPPHACMFHKQVTVHGPACLQLLRWNTGCWTS